MYCLNYLQADIEKRFGKMKTNPLNPNRLLVLQTKFLVNEYQDDNAIFTLPK